ncbi:MAG: lipoate--protein ligase family protein [Leptolyngbyaceae cyanobacterium SM1_4_3]|nr:lipoate--protein ligase family protein [Leptolyngbyaceae cyanobacterium SM1_4_3]
MAIAPNWRLIPPLEASGKVQMAIDRWLLKQHQLGLHPPVLRFYTWLPVAISLGYHQRRYLPQWEHLHWHGERVDLVRRPTGGRAVLHQGDLTYAVIVSGIAGSRMQAYQQICQFLIEGWRSLHVNLHFGEAGRGYIHNPNCFGAATGADLVLPDGKKLIGSAQLHHSGAILQHGSMRLNPDPDLFKQVFGVELEAIALPFYSKETIIEALTTAAQRCFNLHLTPQPLSETEWQEILCYEG